VCAHIGAPLSLSDSARSAWLLEHMQELKQLGPRLTSKGLPRQYALLILRQCLWPRAMFWARVCPPEISGPALQEWDRFIIQTFSDVLDLNLNLDAIGRVQAPLAFGGFGLRPLWGLRYACFLSCFASVLPQVLVVSPALSSTPILEAAKLAHAQLSPSLAQLPWFPASFTDFVNRLRADPHQAAGLQRLITKELEKDVIRSVYRSLSATAQAVMISCSGKHAARWKHTLPTSPALRLSDQQIQLSCAAALLVPIPELDGVLCPCGVHLTASTATIHACACPFAAGAAFTAGHDDIRSELHRDALEARLPVDLETSVVYDAADPSHRVQADVAFPSHGSILLVDVAVCAPGTDFSVDRLGAHRSPSVTARKVESSKLSTYRAAVAARGVSFLPFVVEAFGALGPRSLEVLSALQDAYKERRPSEPANVFISFVLSRLSFIIQRRLANCLAQSLLVWSRGRVVSLARARV
jgi:hypothetical protein